MSIALLTCSRGDRPQLLAHCIKQVAKFTTRFDEHIIISREPTSNAPDLRDRMREGFEEAKEKGITWVVVIEDDDYIPPNYLHRLCLHMDHSDFIGSEFTYYYNLKNLTWERLMHRNHSSLFCTAFRVESMKDFKWNLAHKVFLDLDIWRYARKFRRSFIDTGAIGIKHGIGLTGGIGHKKVFSNKDPDMKWLQSKVDLDSFEFYKSIAYGIQTA